jgi:hypothetical protein
MTFTDFSSRRFSVMKNAGYFSALQWVAYFTGVRFALGTMHDAFHHGISTPS